MPTLSIKNVPEDLLDKLRERAASHHRSIQGELMALLAAAVGPAADTAEASPMSQPRAIRRTGTRRIEEIAAEHRRSVKKPVTRGPSAADLIRSDRDAR